MTLWRTHEEVWTGSEIYAGISFVGGRSTPQVARSLEMSPGTLGNWVARTRKGEALMKRPPGKPLTELEAELARLKQENARLRIEKEIYRKPRL